MIDLTTTLVRKSDVIASSMGDETVMMDFETSNYYGLGRVGGKIWEGLEQQQTVEEVCKMLTASFEVDIDTCFYDIRPFLQQLIEAKLVEVV